MKKIWTVEERNELAAMAKLGSEKARAELMYSMEGLVVTAANKFARVSGMDREELKAEARLIVLETIDKFNPGRSGANFGGQCGYNLKRDLEIFVRQNTGPVSAPKSRHQRDMRFNLRRFLEQKEREGMAAGEARQAACERFRCTETDLAFVLESGNAVGVGPNVDAGEHEPVFEPDAAAELQANLVQSLLAELLDTLEPMDRRFVELRFLSENQMSLDKIAAEFFDDYEDVTKRGVRDRLSKRWETVILPALMAFMRDRGLSLNDLI